MDFAQFISQQLELAKTRPEKVPRGIKKGPRIPVVTQAPKHGCCGNCRFAEYKGLQEVAQRYSYCSIDEFSGRWYNIFNAPACSFWKQRSPSKMQQEHAHQIKWLEAIKNLNHSIQNRSRAAVIINTEKQEVFKKEKKVARIVNRQEHAKSAVLELLGR